MADPEEIERRVEWTPESAYLDRKAGPQRGGLLASLNMIADSLALLPTSGVQIGTEEWRHKRTRWVFLTSRPSIREHLLPLHSVWLDLLILRMMEPCAKPASRSGSSWTRAREPQQTSAAPYRRDREPEVREPGRARLSGRKPT